MLYTFFHKNGGFQVLSISFDSTTQSILESVLQMGFDHYEVIDKNGKTRTGLTQNLLESCKAFKF
jgi:hypothetical protein